MFCKIAHNIFFAFSAILLISFSANAIEITDIEIKQQEKAVVVKGYTASEASGIRIIMEILNPDMNIDEFNYNSSEHKASFFYDFKTTVTGEKGEFEFDSDLSSVLADESCFEVRVGCIDEAPDSGKFNYYSSEVLEKLLEDVNGLVANTSENSADIAALADILRTKSEQFIGYFPFYEEVAKFGSFQDIAARVSMQNTFSQLSEFAKEVKYSILIEAVVKAADSSSAAGYISKYAELTKFPEVIVYNDYLTLSEENKKEACKGFSLTYKTNPSFETEFISNVLIIMLKNANGTGDIAAVLEKYPSVFDLNIYYNSQNNKTQMLKNLALALQNGSAKSIPQVQAILNQFIQNSNGSPGIGGNGGTTGGATGGYITAPVANNGVDMGDLVETKIEKIDFQDLDSVEWAQESIEELIKLKIVSGYSDTVFAPLDNLTRGQYCKLIAKCLNLDEDDMDKQFADVNKNDWYYGFVAALYNRGIITGINDDEFIPDANISRQDISVIAYRAVNYLELNMDADKTDEFNDDDKISDYAREAVYALKASQIINGLDDGRFNPLGNASRAEAAKIVYGLYCYIGEFK